MALLAVTPAFAQDPDQTDPVVRLNEHITQPEATTFEAPGRATVDAKGDLNLTVPLLSLPGRGGLGYDFTLTYNSAVPYDQPDKWVGLGWSLPIPSISRTPSGGLVGGTVGDPDDLHGAVDYVDEGCQPPDEFSVSVPGQGGGSMSMVVLGSPGCHRDTPNPLPTHVTDAAKRAKNDERAFMLHEYRPWEIIGQISDSGRVEVPARVLTNSSSLPVPFVTQRVRTTPNGPDSTVVDDFERFIVTTDDGTRYVYEAPTLSTFITPEYVSGLLELRAETYVNTWRLIAIIGPDVPLPFAFSEASDLTLSSMNTVAGSWVLFEYTAPVAFYTARCSVEPRQGENADVCDDRPNAIRQYRYLSRVVTPTHEAILDLPAISQLSHTGGVGAQPGAGSVMAADHTGAAMDWYRAPALGGIELKDRHTGARLFRVVLSHSDSLGLASSRDGYRTLEEVRYEGPDGEETSRFAFHYPTDSVQNPGWMPVAERNDPLGVDEAFLDHFGFYLGGTGLKRTEAPKDSTSSAIWNLRAVTFPTGAREEYAYANDRIGKAEGEGLPFIEELTLTEEADSKVPYTVCESPAQTCDALDYDFATWWQKQQGGSRVTSIRRTATDGGDDLVTTYTYGRGVASGVPSGFWSAREVGLQFQPRFEYSAPSRGDAAVYYEWVKSFEEDSRFEIRAYFTSESEPECPPASPGCRKVNPITSVRFDYKVGSQTRPFHSAVVRGNEGLNWGEMYYHEVAAQGDALVSEQIRFLPISPAKVFSFDSTQVSLGWRSPDNVMETIDTIWGRGDSRNGFGMFGKRTVYERDANTFYPVRILESTDGAWRPVVNPEQHVRRFRVTELTRPGWPLAPDSSGTYALLEERNQMATVLRQDAYVADVATPTGRILRQTVNGWECNGGFDSSCGTTGYGEQNPTGTPYWLGSTITEWDSTAYGTGSHALLPSRSWQWKTDLPDAQADRPDSNYAWSGPSPGADWVPGSEVTAYDNRGLPETIVGADGTTVTLAYEPDRDLVSQVTVGTGSPSVTRNATYDDWGRVTTISDANGLTGTFRYDGAGRLAEVLGPDGLVLSSHTYLYEPRLASEVLAYPMGNLLANGNFEQGDPDIPVRPSKWDENTCGTSARTEGEAALGFHAGYVSGSTDCLAQTVDLKAGEAYALVAWVRDNHGDARINLDVDSPGTATLVVEPRAGFGSTPVCDGDASCELAHTSPRSSWHRTWALVTPSEDATVSVLLTTAIQGVEFDAVTLAAVPVTVDPNDDDAVLAALQPLATTTSFNPLAQPVQTAVTSGAYAESEVRLAGMEYSRYGDAEKTWLPYVSSLFTKMEALDDDFLGGAEAEWGVDSRPYSEAKTELALEPRVVEQLPAGDGASDVVKTEHRILTYERGPGDLIAARLTRTLTADQRTHDVISNLSGHTLEESRYTSVPLVRPSSAPTFSLSVDPDSTGQNNIVNVAWVSDTTSFTAAYSGYAVWDVDLQTSGYGMAEVRLYERTSDDTAWRELWYEQAASSYSTGSHEFVGVNVFHVEAGRKYRVKVSAARPEQPDDPTEEPCGTCNGSATAAVDVWQPSSDSDDLVATTRYEYDPAGRLTRVLPPNAFREGATASDWATTYTYDSAGQALTTNTPDANADPTKTDDPDATFSYDIVGRLRFSRDAKQIAKGDLVFTTYDDLGRPTQSGIAELGRSYSGSLAPSTFAEVNPDVSYSFESDADTWIQAYAYDAAPDTLEAPWSLHAADIAAFYGSTPRLVGRLAAEAYQSAGTWQTTLYRYDAYGRVEARLVLTEGYPVGEAFEYAYDASGRLLRESVTVGDDAFTQLYRYDAYGNLDRVWARADGDDTVPATVDLAYSHDIRGSVTETKLGEQADGTWAETLATGYDIRGRLVALGDEAIEPDSSSQQTKAAPYSARLTFAPGGLITEVEHRNPNAVYGSTADARGRYVLDYDGLGRLVDATWEEYAGIGVTVTDSTWSQTAGTCSAEFSVNGTPPVSEEQTFTATADAPDATWSCELTSFVFDGDPSTATCTITHVGSGDVLLDASYTSDTWNACDTEVVTSSAPVVDGEQYTIRVTASHQDRSRAIARGTVKRETMAAVFTETAGLHERIGSATESGYDSNGNILSLKRWDETGAIIDTLRYEYVKNDSSSTFNRLTRVTEQGGWTGRDTLAWDAETERFYYDENGTLVRSQVKDPVMNWTNVYQVTQMDEQNRPTVLTTQVPGEPKLVHRYRYGSGGWRVWKETDLEGGCQGISCVGVFSSERHVRDGDRLLGVLDSQGNVKFWNITGPGGVTPLGRLERGNVTQAGVSIDRETAITRTENRINSKGEEKTVERVADEFEALGVSTADADSSAQAMADAAAAAGYAVEAWMLGVNTPTHVRGAIESIDEAAGQDDAAANEYLARVNDDVGQVLWTYGNPSSNCPSALTQSECQDAVESGGAAAAAWAANRVGAEVEAATTAGPDTTVTTWVRRYYVTDHLGSVR
ncbi:MAG: hypothetical protein AAGI52_06000, partial [Bacteroidota bacterium]